MRHPFDLTLSELEGIHATIQRLTDVELTHIAAGKGALTTMATGEEGGGDPTTMAVGEEGGGYTTAY